MDDAQRRDAKRRLVAGMVRGRPWADAVAEAVIRASRSSAYRWVRAVRAHGETALADGRHGHASKLRPPVRHWLVEYCRGSPHIASRMVQTALGERFGVTVSVRHINDVRAASR